MQNRKVPYFFLTRQTGDTHEKFEGSITLVPNIQNLIIGVPRRNCGSTRVLLNGAGVSRINIMFYDQTKKQVHRGRCKCLLVAMKQKLQDISSLIWKINVFQSFDKEEVYMARQINVSGGRARFMTVGKKLVLDLQREL